MAELTNDMQVHIVRCLAVFMQPADIIKEMKDLYNVEILPPQISYYNPYNRSAKDLREELRVEFEETRKLYRESADNIPIANKVWRLQELQRVRDNHLKNPVMVMNALEQAAKECGEAYTNKRELSGPNGQPLPPTVAVTVTKELIQETIKDMGNDY